MELKKVSVFNYFKLKKLSSYSKSFNKRNLNVFQKIRSVSLRDKIYILKHSYLILYDNRFVGYIWVNELDNKLLLIKDFYLDNNYQDIECFNSNKTYIYETFLNSKCNALLSNLGFCINDVSDIMRLDLNYKCLLDNLEENIDFVIFEKNVHEKIRCELQNDIFDSDDRISITIDDIIFDEEQDYYIDDGFIFLKANNDYIGMGQIILLDDKLFIVNFGIKKQYRNKGYARKLLNKLIEKGKYIGQILNKDKIYLRVSRENKKAYTLYVSIGFKYDNSIISWKR